MSQIKYSLLLCVLFFTQTAKADWGIWQAYLIANFGGADAYYSTGQDINDPTPTLNNLYLGRYTSSGTLIIDGAEVKTFKNGSSNVCGASMFYRIYRTCDAPGSFNEVTTGIACNFPCSGLNSGGDQKWDNTTANINALAGLTLSGTYVIEVYFQGNGNQNNPSGCGESAFSSNGGSNFRAYFEFNNNDSFADGNFTANPIWSGDVAQFQVVNNSDVGGLLGTELVRTHTLRANGTGAGTHSMTTQITSWLDQQDWYFWIGRRELEASGSNRIRVFLYSNSANIEGGSGSGVNGYAITFGTTDNDPIEFQRITNGVASVQFTSTASIADNLIDYGVSFHISRSETGVWTIRTSPLPQNAIEAQATPTALSCPETASTVVHGTVLDNTHVPTANGFFGIIASVTSTGLQSSEFDNFRFRAQLPNTKVAFVGTTNTVTESTSNFSTTIGVNLTSPDVFVGASVQVVLVSGDGSRLAGYAPQTITWAPGEGGTKFATFSIAANTVCDDIDNLVFQLQNLTGGLNPTINEPSNFTLVVVDDDTGFATLINDNFEDGNSNGWQSFNGAWGASNVAPSSGLWSLRRSSTGTAGNSHVVFNTEGSSLNGVTTTWRFNVKHFNRDPSPNNRFLVALASDSTNLAGAYSGYAIGAFPEFTGDTDFIKFYRVTNGVLTLLATTSFDVTTSVNEIGFNIERSDAGVWTIQIDPSGDFDNLATVATVTDTAHDNLSFFGVRFEFSSTNSDRLALDDVSVIQKGCRVEYFSQVPGGNLTGAIWSDQTIGTPIAINPGRFTRLTVQAGAPVTFNSDLVCNAFSIRDGAVVNAQNANMRMYGNFATEPNATFNPGTSTVVFKGTELQSVAGSAEPTFYNMTIDNVFGTVTLMDTVRVQNVVTVSKGTLQTGGRLILLSNASRSASIGPLLNGADVSGLVTIQRFITGGSAGYVYLGASTVASPHTIENVWDDDLVTTGVAGSDFPPPYNFVNIYSYNESVLGNRNAGWTPMTNTSNTIDVLRGYSIYMGPGSWTTDVTGNIQKGNVTVPLSYTVTPNVGDGWNLLTNIYPSEIDFLSLEQNSSDINFYHLYDNNLPGYRVYSANLGLGSAPRYIAHSQAFFVKATAVNQSLNFTENVKTATNVAFERSMEDSRFIRFTINRNGQGDEALIAFTDDATNAYDMTLDVEKLESPVASAPELAFVSSDAMLLTIDARPMPYEEMEIPMYLDLPAAGDYEIQITETQNLPFGSCFVIEDVIAGTMYTLEEGLSFIVSTDAPYQGNRVIIRVTPSLVLNTENISCNAQDDGAIAINAASGDWNWTVTNELGVVVFEGAGATEVTNLSAGTYDVVLANANGNCAAAQASVTLTEPSATLFEFGAEIASCNLGNTGELILNITNPGNYDYQLVNLNGEIITSGNGTANLLSIDGLAADNYALTITNACISETFEFTTIDENAVSVEPATNQTSFEWEAGTSLPIELTVSAYAADNVVWMLNGEQVGTGHVIPFILTEAGTYVFEVTASTATCEANTTVTITGTTFTTVNVDEASNGTLDIVRVGDNAVMQLPSGIGNVHVMVYNAMGQIVFEQREIQNTSNASSIPMATWSAGIYTFKIFTNETELLTKKLVK